VAGTLLDPSRFLCTAPGLSPGAPGVLLKDFMPTGVALRTAGRQDGGRVAPPRPLAPLTTCSPAVAARTAFPS